MDPFDFVSWVPPDFVSSGPPDFVTWGPPSAPFRAPSPCKTSELFARNFVEGPGLAKEQECGQRISVRTAHHAIRTQATVRSPQGRRSTRLRRFHNQSCVLSKISWSTGRSQLSDGLSFYGLDAPFLARDAWPCIADSKSRCICPLRSNLVFNRSHRVFLCRASQQPSSLGGYCARAAVSRSRLGCSTAIGVDVYLYVANQRSVVEGSRGC